MNTAPAARLDLAYARSQFPALAGETVFLDNAGGSQVLKGVVDRIGDYLLETNVQQGASYPVAQRSAARLYEAQLRALELFGARRPEEIVMGPSSTLLLQLLARGLAGRIRPGDQVVVTRIDHESNIGPWVGLGALGVEVRFWEMDREGLGLNLADLDRLMTERTRLVCFTHASNILGSETSLVEITRFVHARGSQVCVDGVAYAPHRAVDVVGWDVDYYVLSFYKVYGPHHAALYGKYDHLLGLANLYHYFIGEDRIPYKLQPGNPNYELSYGAAGIADYLAELGTRSGAAPSATRRQRIEAAFDAIADHEAALAERLLGYLRSKPRVRVIGSPQVDAARLPTISFVVQDTDPEAVVCHIDALGIGIRFGDFHSRRLVDHLGLTPRKGVVRVSLVHYNTLDEVERLVRGLEQVL